LDAGQTTTGGVVSVSTVTVKEQLAALFEVSITLATAV